MAAAVTLQGNLRDRNHGFHGFNGFEGLASVSPSLIDRNYEDIIEERNGNAV